MTSEITANATAETVATENRAAKTTASDTRLEVAIAIHLPALPLPQDTAQRLCEQLISKPPIGESLIGEPSQAWHWTGQIAETELISTDHPLKLALELEAAGYAVRWQTPFASSQSHEPFAEDLTSQDWPSNLPAYDWPSQPKILALVPHRSCEPWLHRCLTSLTQQSLAPTNIVVIDDASTPPPLAIVKAFPQVTLLRATESVGPYGLIQAVIARTDYDAYLFQDADDWSSDDRLETLLDTARRHRAELVGSQEIRVLEPGLQLQSIGYPLAVNAALARAPGHPLLHPTSLVTRDLVQRLGGFATGLRFGGDTEFLLRAQWVARIVNSPRYCYFRRKRPGSLTTAAATGLGSPARRSLTERLKQRARDNTAAAARGEAVNLKPLSIRPAVQLQHCCGPQLRQQPQTSGFARQ